MVVHAFMHRVLAEYLSEAPQSMVVECVEALAGDVSQSLVRGNYQFLYISDVSLYCDCLLVVTSVFFGYIR